MKRRLTALLLCGALFAAILTPALAAEETAAKTYDVSWEELEGRVLDGSYTAQTIQSSINRIEAIDYDAMQEGLKDQMNAIVDIQWGLGQLTSGANSNMVSVSGAASAAAASAQLGSGYSSLRDAFDAIDDGDTQEDYAKVVRQLQNGLEQLVTGTQSLYITILSLEQSLADGCRGVDTIDRSLTELRLRQQLGQVSAQQVASLEQTRADTVSQLKSLENTITTCKIQLQTLMGEEATGNLTLAPLPESFADGYDWNDLDYAADLEKAKANSWDLYDAQNTLDDAYDDYVDSLKTSWKYQKEMGEHAWSAAQATYNSSVQSFETSFKSVYDSLGNYQQIWETKQSAVTYSTLMLLFAQVKYDRGMISKNALLDAQDDLADARSAEESAWRDLFTARNNYRNAVERGLVSSSN